MKTVLSLVAAVALACVACAQTTTPPGTSTTVGGTDPTTIGTQLATAMATDSPFALSLAYATDGKPYTMGLYSPKNYDWGHGLTFGWDVASGASLDSSTTFTAGLGFDLAKDFGSNLSVHLSLIGAEAVGAGQKVHPIGILGLGLKYQF